MNKLQDFLKRYDPGHNLNFNNIKFRPGASRTTPFGIDITTPEYTPLRIHLAVDSGYSSSTDYKIYAPFDFKKAEFISSYGSFGTMLILYTNYDFEIRIAHMNSDEFSPALKIALNEKSSIQAGELLGSCGNVGLSFGDNGGKHAHTEIVSSVTGITILNDILEEKFGRNEAFGDYSEKEIESFIENSTTSLEEGRRLYNNEFNKRKIHFVNNYQSLRIDYHTNEKRLFYNSMALFGM